MISRIRHIRLIRWLTATRRRKALSVLLVILVLLTSLRLFFFPVKEVQAADIYIGFDEGYGASASDTNSTVTAGTITNAVWKTEDLCKFGKCLYFDGTGDYVSYSDSASLDMAASDTVTVELWFRTPDITSGTRTLISKEEATGADGGYKITMNSSGQIVFGIDNNNTSFPSDSVTSASAYDDNKWHHLAAVKNGTSSITLYINAISVGTDASLAGTDASNDDNFYIGIYNAASDGWSGFIDEVKVLRTARTATEIKADYVGETPSRGTSASFGPDQSYLSDGLVGYWKLDETSGNATDSSGNGITLTNNGTTTFVGAKFGRGSEHVPASTQYFSTATTIQGAKSVSFWVNPDSTTNYYLSLHSGAHVTSSSGILSATGFTNPKIYVNGVESSTIAQDTWQLVTVSSSQAITANQIYIGRQGSNYFDGTMDEVRVYNRVLQPVEVERLYNWAQGPVSYWKLDENTGTAANDSGEKDNTGTLTGGPVWAPGKIGSGLSTIATSYVNVPDPGDGSLDFAGTDDFTLEAWVKSDNAATSQLIIWKDLAGTTPGYRMRFTSTGKLGCDLSDSAAGTDTFGSNATIADGNWHFVTCVYNGSAATPTISHYIDGVFDKVTNQTHTGDHSNATAFHISDNSNGIIGQVDNVLVYRYARTSAQIIEDMNAGHPAPGSPVGSAVAHWKFDEGYGTTVNDSSGNTNSLTQLTQRWTNSGKYGKAWDGNGNVWLSRADDSDFDFTASQDFSISLWFKSDSTTNPSAGNEYLIDKETGTGYAIYATQTNGYITFGIDSDGTWTPADTAGNTTDYYDNTWHHAVAVKTGTSKIELFIDGQLVGFDANLAATGDLSNSDVIVVGAQDASAGGTDEFIGDIDEVQIFRSALTSDQVRVLYNQSSSAVWGATSTDSSSNATWSSSNEYCTPGQSSACTAPIAHYKFDENTGTTDVNDSSGNSNIGTMNGSMTNSDWVPGKFGSALDFDGSDDYISLGTPSSLNTQYITIEAWVDLNNPGDGVSHEFYNRMNSSNAGTTLLRKRNSDNKYVFQIRLDGTESTVRVIASNTAATSGWHHVAGTYDGSILKMYVDGVLQTDTLTISGTIDIDTLNSIDLARHPTPTNYLGGKLDDVRIYNYARTQPQISWEYNRGAPQGWWKMDENTGSTTNDSSGNAYHSQTFNGNTTWTTGKRNTGLTFDGTDDNVRITEGSGIDLGETTHSYSVSAWFKTTTNYTTNSGTIVAKAAGIGVYPFNLEVNTSEQPCILMNDGAARTLCGTSTVNDGNWHLIVGVRDVLEDVVTLYIDGLRVRYQTDPTTASMVNNDDLSFGNAGAGGYLNNDFNGQIDDVKIFNYDLSAQQVRNVYNEGALRFGPNEGSP